MAQMKPMPALTGFLTILTLLAVIGNEILTPLLALIAIPVVVHCAIGGRQ